MWCTAKIPKLKMKRESKLNRNSFDKYRVLYPISNRTTRALCNQLRCVQAPIIHWFFSLQLFFRSFDSFLRIHSLNDLKSIECLHQVDRWKHKKNNKKFPHNTMSSQASTYDSANHIWTNDACIHLGLSSLLQNIRRDFISNYIMSMINCVSCVSTF